MLFIIKQTGQPNRFWQIDGTLLDAKAFAKKCILDPTKPTRIYNPRGKLVTRRKSARSSWDDKPIATWRA